MMEQTALYSYLKKSFLTGSLKTVVVAVSTLVFLPLIIQRIGFEKYGLISLTMMFASVSVLADFGISKSVTFLIGEDSSSENVNTLISTAMLLNVCAALFVVLIFTLLAVLEVPIFGSETNMSPNLIVFIIALGAGYIVLMLFNNLMVAILDSFFLLHYVNVGFMLVSFFSNVCIYTSASISDSVYVLLLTPFSVTCLLSLYFFIVVKVNVEFEAVFPSYKSIKKMISVSFKFMNIGLVNALVIPLNKYLLMFVTGNSAILGIFDLGMKIALLANSFLTSISMPLFGVFSRTKDKGAALGVIKKVTLLVFALYLFGCALYYFVGGWVAAYVDPEWSSEIYVVAGLLIVGVGSIAVSESCYKGLMGFGQLRTALYLKAITPIFNVVACLAIYLFFSPLDFLYTVTISYSVATFVGSMIIVLYGKYFFTLRD